MSSGGFNWYVIKTNSNTSDNYKPVPPVFKEEPNCRCNSAHVAVGSTIYSLGGEEPGHNVSRLPYFASFPL